MKPITIEGKKIGADNLQELLTESNPALLPVYTFLCEWYDPSPVVRVQTSGSTGSPKIMEVEKERMIQSARMTCEFLHLKEGDTALLCMSPQYIGAKMMIVRAWAAGMNLLVREPSGHPLHAISQPVDFAAMIPLQVYNSLRVSPEKKILASINTVIIGGSHIDTQLEIELSRFPNSIYVTYGMTETLSHIALRKINGKDESERYAPLPGIKISLSPQQTLLIDAPLLSPKPIVTNDIAEIDDKNTFRILGRTDNIINSGGIKILVEELEETIHSILNIPVAITYTEDDKFGQKVVLLTESKEKPRQILEKLKPRLNPYHLPKQIIQIEYIPLTENGKIDRQACKKIACFK